MDSTSHASSGFAEAFAARSRAILDRARQPLERLRGIAAALRMPQAEQNFQQSLEGLARPTFTLIVLGRFKNGKSTFLNILLGTTPHAVSGMGGLHGAPLPMDDLPATARLTTITYGDEPTVTIVRNDGTEEERSLDWFRHEAKLRANEADNRAAFADVAEFRVTYPFPAGKAGIRLIDSPGTDEAPERTAIALRAISQSDAAIMVFRSDQLMSQPEMDFVRTMANFGLNSFFTVINRWNGMPVDGRFRAYAWEKRVSEFEGGPTYAGQDLREKRIFFLDAKSALQGRLEGDEAAVDASGMGEFESELNRYYETERRQVHVHRWIDLADIEARRITDYIDRAEPALACDAEEFSRNYVEIQPRIAELAARRVRLLKIFVSFQERAKAALLTGYQDLLSDVLADLQGNMKRGAVRQGEKRSVLADVVLPSTASWGSRMWTALNPMQQRKAVEEALAAANEYVSARTQDWAAASPPDSGARKILDPLFEELLLDLEDEVREVEAAFDEMQFELSGQPTVASQRSDARSDWWERILPTAAGLLTGGLDGAVMGATNKWKGFGKGLALQFGVFGAIAVATGGLSVPMIALGAVVTLALRAAWRGSDIESESKEKIVDLLARGDSNRSSGASGTHFEGLQGEARKAGPSLTAALDRMLMPFRAQTLAAFDEEVARQVAMFEEMQRHSALAAEEKLALREEFIRVQREVEVHRELLAEVRAMASSADVETALG